MELKVDKTNKILLGAIALGLFLNASNVFIDKAYASDCVDKVELRSHVEKIIYEIEGAKRLIESNENQLRIITSSVLK